MRLKTTSWSTSILLVITVVAGQDINAPQVTPSSPLNYDTAYNNPPSTPNPNLDVNPYNPYSTQDPRYGSNDPNVVNDPYGQNDPYGRREPYGPVGKDDPYSNRDRGQYGPYDNDQFDNRGRTPWRNNIFGGGRTQFDVHNSIIREA